GRRVGERERIRPPGRDGLWPFGCPERLVDRDVPLVALVSLPDHHHQPPGRAQRAADVGECGTGGVEEHRAEPADGQGETFVRKAVDLRVGVLEGDVAEPLGPGEFAGALDGGRGDVDAKCAAGLGRARGLPGRLPGPAADVKDVIVELDATGPAQHLVVPPQFGVVTTAADRGRAGHTFSWPSGTAGACGLGGPTGLIPHAMRGGAGYRVVEGCLLARGRALVRWCEDGQIAAAVWPGCRYSAL